MRTIGVDTLVLRIAAVVGSMFRDACEDIHKTTGRHLGLTLAPDPTALAPKPQGWRGTSGHRPQPKPYRAHSHAAATPRTAAGPARRRRGSSGHLAAAGA